MTKKYSEEEYNKIIEAFQSKINYDTAINEVIEVVSDMRGLVPTEEIQQAISLALPISREWAHDKFVEKEKKYYWTSKQEDGFGEKARLFMRGDGESINQHFSNEFNFDYDSTEKLTESEIKLWGFNPEAFDKEEVKR